MAELRVVLNRLEAEHTRSVVVALAKGKAAAVTPAAATRQVLPNENCVCSGFGFG